MAKNSSTTNTDKLSASLKKLNAIAITTKNTFGSGLNFKIKIETKGFDKLTEGIKPLNRLEKVIRNFDLTKLQSTTSNIKSGLSSLSSIKDIEGLTPITNSIYKLKKSVDGFNIPILKRLTSVMTSSFANAPDFSGYAEIQTIISPFNRFNKMLKNFDLERLPDFSYSLNSSFANAPDFKAFEPIAGIINPISRLNRTMVKFDLQKFKEFFAIFKEELSNFPSIDEAELLKIERLGLAYANLSKFGNRSNRMVTRNISDTKRANAYSYSGGSSSILSSLAPILTALASGTYFSKLYSLSKDIIETASKDKTMGSSLLENRTMLESSGINVSTSSSEMLNKQRELLGAQMFGDIDMKKMTQMSLLGVNYKSNPSDIKKSYMQMAEIDQARADYLVNAIYGDELAKGLARYYSVYSGSNDSDKKYLEKMSSFKPSFDLNTHDYELFYTDYNIFMSLSKHFFQAIGGDTVKFLHEQMVKVNTAMADPRMGSTLLKLSHFLGGVLKGIFNVFGRVYDFTVAIIDVVDSIKNRFEIFSKTFTADNIAKWLGTAIGLGTLTQIMNKTGLGKFLNAGLETMFKGFSFGNLLKGAFSKIVFVDIALSFGTTLMEMLSDVFNKGLGIFDSDSLATLQKQIGDLLYEIFRGAVLLIPVIGPALATTLGNTTVEENVKGEVDKLTGDPRGILGYSTDKIKDSEMFNKILNYFSQPQEVTVIIQDKTSSGVKVNATTLRTNQ